MKNISRVSLGQFFTPEYIASYMISMLDKPKDSVILEPSSGNGIFLSLLQKSGYSNLYAYEIDKEVISHSFVKNSSFVSSKDESLYDVVIGNPPYVRWKNLEEFQKSELNNNILWKNHFNSLCDYFYIFILKSVLQLKHSGELIFICPDYWLSTKNAKTLRKFLIENGSFEKIILFNECHIFDGVLSSIMIFKYQKGVFNTSIEVRNIPSKTNVSANSDINNLGEIYKIKHFSNDDTWVISPENIRLALDEFEKSCADIEANSLFSDMKYSKIEDVCDIGNGMVSGLDRAFQMRGDTYSQKEMQHSINVIKAKHLQPFLTTGSSKYKFVLDDMDSKEFESNFPNFYEEFKPYREDLLKRYNYNKPLKYWQWAFLRNFSLFNKNEKKIFVPCKERISNKTNFRFSLVEEYLYPTQDVTAIYKKNQTKESIEYITAYLNSRAVFLWLKNKGVIKGDVVEFSEKPLASIPFRKINWTSLKERKIHEDITQLVRKYQASKDVTLIDKINNNLEALGIKVSL
ncbi:class I SAM-dependent methyltransferase [Actinobacillus pleuropneumoniae]|uniref:class I SAM-dependent methyltransferase n=1 Tax=Actinobacillus pleuropneumoniae TaxID=715 RepID=UPI0001E497D5|nr:class I SAM-dependent methyltransferase [Actinobacillus pleuropneumoniae]EFM99921.1 Modification methylase HincII [Actinobacillus pleuropneumoniae serovar 12 str. 1096]UKH20843.1 class I SAM-dependent methyltransferase [Actinobacillus pleuropneumoniae]UKH29443.1 class I SAM-dependent methyltransferase [Actinobacillus pleuropneumoniae]UPA20589.1 class I SAM-dependent methyltransferase [Actinobacillus pleuropneumoniae]